MYSTTVLSRMTSRATRSSGLPLFGVELVQGDTEVAPKRFKSVTVESDGTEANKVDEVGVGDFLSQ